MKKSMPKKNIAKKGPSLADEMWINPNSSLKGDRGDRAWENRAGGVPSSSRYLELADLALGLKKPEPRKKKSSSAAHQTGKTEPYSS
jgi:hypothetical protein